MSKTPKPNKERTPEQIAARDAMKAKVRGALSDAAVAVIPAATTAIVTTVVGIAITSAYMSKYGHKVKPTKVVLPEDYDTFYPSPSGI